jgi:hypothetical protein
MRLHGNAELSLTCVRDLSRKAATEPRDGRAMNGFRERYEVSEGRRVPRSGLICRHGSG